MSRVFLLLTLLLVTGCVQVDTGDAKPVTPTPPNVNDQFANVDQALLAKILAEPELQDAERLRRYAALYKGAANVLNTQPDVPMMKVLTGVHKATADFMKPRSVAIQAIVKSIMPESAGAETDRPEIAGRFAALSLACHAAAHRIDTQSSK